MKSKFIAVLSPAKLIDDKIHYPEISCTQPEFLSDAAYIVKQLKEKSVTDLAKMMAMSTALASETKRRFSDWHLPFDHDNAIPSLLMFKGEVYRGLGAKDFNDSDLEFANNHLRIVSGLYGILKPLDFVMPYRLMMGSPISLKKGQKNLYDYWGERLCVNLRNSLDQQGVVLNLASQEYSRALCLQNINRTVIQCEFLEKKGDKFSMTSTYSKLARGRMARFLITNRVNDLNGIKNFDEDGYLFNKKLSTESLFTFTRS